VILPSHPIWKLEAWKTQFSAKEVEPGFKYHSGINSDWLDVRQIRDLTRKHVDPNFEV
jgi:hypothetical protein